jgi:hypothetical protein
LVLYLKDAKKWGHKALLRKYVLIVNRQTYNLSYLRKNNQLEAASRQLETPMRSQDMIQQRTENLEMQEQNKARQLEDRAIAAVWSRSTDARKTSPQRESTEHSTSQCPRSAETTDDVNVTMQTDGQQYKLRSWLTMTAEPSGKKTTGQEVDPHRDLMMWRDY